MSALTLGAVRRTRCDRTPAWAALQAAAADAQAFDLRTAFAADTGRFERLSLSAPHVFADLSKNLIDERTQALLLDLAQQCGVAAHRDAMFAGVPINNTEQRQVLHTLLRNPAPALAAPDDLAPENVASELVQVHATLDAMLAFAETVRADATITDVVNIGIGGSDLGPQMAVLALDAFAAPGKRVHFVSNVDGHELAAVLARGWCKRTIERFHSGRAVPKRNEVKGEWAP